MDPKDQSLSIKNVMKTSSLDKPFLLVFHGGFVGYLLLHNFIIPIIGNIGKGYPVLSEVSWYFLTHGWLFYVFAKTKRYGDISLPFIINASIFLFSIVVILMDLKDGISTTEFSRLISLTAMSIFFLGFFIRFKNFFSWHTSFKKIFSGFFMGFIFVICQSFLQKESIPEKKESTDKKERPLVVLSLPSSNFSQNTIEITSNFKDSVVRLPMDSSPVLKNNTTKTHLIRLEYIKNKRWYFKKIIKLKKGEEKSLSLKTKGFYRLYSPSSKIGICHIIVGSDLFKKGDYLLSKKGLI